MTNTHEIRPLSPAQIEVLMRDLDPSRVAQRATPGSSKKMSYLEGHDVKATLVRVFGFGGFSADVVNGQILRLEEIDVPEFAWKDGKKSPVMVNGVQKMKKQWRAVATATVRLAIHQLGATYTEMAVSSQNGNDPGEVADFAIKTAETDALKRSAIYLGSQFGLSLYADGATQDQIRVVFEPLQSQALFTERENIRRAWEQANAPQQPYAPAGGPVAPQMGAVPLQHDPAVQAGMQGAMAQLQAGVNVAAQP